MSFKTILVPVDSSSSAEARILAAADLARQCDAALIGVGAEQFQPPGISAAYGYIDPDILGALKVQIDRDLERAEHRFHHLTGTVDRGVRWMGGVDLPSRSVIMNARGADLIVTSRPGQGNANAFVAPVADLIMEAGVPVLFLPEEQDSVDCRRVLVAWKDSREARRALADALPFLRRAEEVVLLEVREAGHNGQASHGIRAVRDRLQGHDVNAAIRVETRTREAVADTILNVAGDCGASMVVTGAYGHSRLREWALGGVTQGLIDRTTRPVFFSR
ncbi:Universal stress protein family protein [Faunimonas pinastri]|uniref:Universal stress protein family protein n=1 Tax=Faunimonas pinastri TaxID=1855383 RepID=A0A1H9MGL7_9HYPH|nr:universal stress protein [Faunimonas pinastri]SER22617.1 Universal stress protein family protein [Faunimonas pinastri]